jgi:histidinol-phosphatase (PHP family)
MKLFNLHTHTRFSDGSSEPADYIAEAIRQGFHTLGFSDHAPVPFANSFAIAGQELGAYCEAVLELSRQSAVGNQQSEGRRQTSEDRRQKGNNEIINLTTTPNPVGQQDCRLLTADCRLLLGLEVDYIPNVTSPFAFYRSNYPLDYLIGSVHLVKNENSENLWFIDGPEISIYDQGLADVFAGDAIAGVTAYYRQIQEMVKNEKPDIIGHLDKIKMYNRGRYFSESDSWYVSLVDETLAMIKEAGCVVEVNTRGIYKKRSDTLFPGPEILKKIHDLNIPITITSDAHKPAEISNYFAEARAMLMEIGFKNQVLLTKTGWEEIPLRPPVQL